MSLVLDASVALNWCFPDEQNEQSRTVMDYVIRREAIVPELWYLDVANGLQVAIRRRRITPQLRDESLVDLAHFSITIDKETSQRAWNDTLQLADQHGLSLYDAAYLELAQRLRLPLASADARLQQAAEAANIRQFTG